MIHRLHSATFILLALSFAANCAAQSTRVIGFADVGYLATDREIPEGFKLGQLVGHISSGLSERVTFFGEVSATPRSTGFGVEVERLLLRYDFADYLKVSAGRYHTPIGYWNAAFHHGLWLQTSVARPEMIKFGSKYLPVHFVGVLLEGALPSSGLAYFAGLGNGRNTNIGRAGDAGDVNDQRAFLAGFKFRPQMLFGLQVGGSVYHDRIAVDSVNAVDESTFSAHLVYEKEQPEVIAEYAWVVHNPLRGGRTTTNRAYYVQVAYRSPDVLRMLKPYARLEQDDVAKGDPIFEPLNLAYKAVVVGLRYDFADMATLKAEYRNERFVDAKRVSSFYLQVSFTFASLASHGL